MTTITLTHKGIEYIMHPAMNGCEGCAFNLEYLDCTAPRGFAYDLDCGANLRVIWVRDEAADAKPEPCCGQPNTCEQPCFHASGRTTPGQPGAIAGVPDYNPDDVAFKPHGRSPHEPGVKLDAGKTRMSLVMAGFPNALMAVADVATYGAQKYTPHGWRTVPNGIERYTDAMYRHLLAEHTGESVDQDTGLYHAAHAAWNALARLELILGANE